MEMNAQVQAFVQQGYLTSSKIGKGWFYVPNTVLETSKGYEAAKYIASIALEKHKMEDGTHYKLY